MATPSPEERQGAFEQSVAVALHLWPALTLAVQNQWGGPDSQDKRAWFAGAIASEFPDIPALLARRPRNPERGDDDDSTEIPDAEYIETMLLQVMVDEFEVTVDDDSAYGVAEDVVRLWAQCSAGHLDEANQLNAKWQSRCRASGAAGVVFNRGEDPDQDTDYDSSTGSDDDHDHDHTNHDGGINGDAMDMDDMKKREKPPLEIDDDGFTKVSRRKR